MTSNNMKQIRIKKEENTKQTKEIKQNKETQKKGTNSMVNQGKAQKRNQEERKLDKAGNIFKHTDK